MFSSGCWERSIKFKDPPIENRVHLCSSTMLGKNLAYSSGGCLESDLHRKALHALADNQAHIVRYDSTDKEDVTFQLGLGCGGIVDILPSTHQC